MNDKTSHPLAVKTPLSKLYLALFSAPLLMLAPADIARADDAIFDGDAKLPNHWPTPGTFTSAVIKAATC